MPRPRKEEPPPSAEDLSVGRPARSIKKPKWLDEDGAPPGDGAVPVAEPPTPVAPVVAAPPQPPVVSPPVKRGPGRPPGSGHKQQHLAAAAALAAQQALAPAQAVDHGDGASPYSRRERVPKRPSHDEIGGLKDLIPKSRAQRAPGQAGYTTPTHLPSSPMRPAAQAPQVRAFPEGIARPYPLSGPGSMKGRKRQLMDDATYATPPRPVRDTLPVMPPHPRTAADVRAASNLPLPPTGSPHSAEPSPPLRSPRPAALPAAPPAAAPSASSARPVPQPAPARPPAQQPPKPAVHHGTTGRFVPAGGDAAARSTGGAMVHTYHLTPVLTMIPG